ncbi:hypothetical protein EV379_2812 [Microterricola gilva]|uniref:CU044_5270 family protein n=1 Tax=Microterricola gilva TaxID=393267 RepID=A0A4Q8AQU7_9MICO|nr:hypothetical protein [Microterricola gilva]RZU66455.1 hypothetical protein EV379_2812 [Microterricola gilva]
MDELERLVRNARPISGHRSLPLSDRAKRELADLLPGDQSSVSRSRLRLRPSRFLRVVGIALAVAVVAALGTVATTSILSPQPTYAATPRMLQPTETADTARELLTQMAQELVGSAQLAEAPYAISVQAWTLATNDDGVAISSSITPENYEFTRGADGSFRTTVTFAQPVDGDGTPVSGHALPAEGDLSWEESWAPGEYQFLFPTRFPDNAEVVGPYLSTLSGGDSPSAGAVIQALNSVLMEQQLNGTQQVALLTYLAELSDLHVVGPVVDRLGRNALLFTANDTDRAGYEEHLIVSPDTGKILATETVYTGNDRTDIHSPSVVNYYLWK